MLFHNNLKLIIQIFWNKDQGKLKWDISYIIKG